MEDQLSENEIRKVIWRRKELVDEKIATESFAKLPAAEQDAEVISIQLNIDLKSVNRCLAGTATSEEMALLKSRIADAFKYGKRAALRPLKTALSAHPYLTSEDDAK